MMSTPRTPRRQSGASLIEVLIAVLVLSFGMLALGGMLSYAVQMPKLSGYRSSATTIAASHIELMRANVAGVRLGLYESLASEKDNFGKKTWLEEQYIATKCAYPNCTGDNIAQPQNLISTGDINDTMAALRRELPPGNDSSIGPLVGFPSLWMKCNGPCSSMDRPEGDLWVVWSEPPSFAGFDAAGSEECPKGADAPSYDKFGTTVIRCIHLRFKI